MRRYPGVIITRVGYTGDVPNATYRNHGTHAEAIQVIFDPEKLGYRKLLEFFQLHDPTTLNRRETIWASVIVRRFSIPVKSRSGSVARRLRTSMLRDGGLNRS